MILINPAYNFKQIDIIDITSMIYKCEIITDEYYYDYNKYLLCSLYINNEIFKQDRYDWVTTGKLINFAQDFNNMKGDKIYYPGRGFVDFPNVPYYTDTEYTPIKLYEESLNIFKVLLETDYHKFSMLINDMIIDNYIPTINDLNDNCYTKDYEIVTNKSEDMYENIVTKSGRIIRTKIHNTYPDGYVKAIYTNLENNKIILNSSDDIIRGYLRPAIIGIFR